MSTPPLPPRDPPTATRTDADRFLGAVLHSKLLDRARLDPIIAKLSPAVRTSARGLADHLVAAGHLTHYQAAKLLEGRSQGLVLGPYLVLAPLGKGGMGTVYLARDSRLVSADPAAGLVGLKVLSPKKAREDEKTLTRFRREMELGRHLAHLNVTRTWDAGVIDGVHYIAMEYVPGQSLRQLVEKRGPLAVADAARLFADVAAGLAHAHERGLIHRDLKPSNIMVTPEGRAKVLDLGLALLVDEALPDDPTIVGGEGYILGTMDYIAPEQTTNSTDVGPWSDLYSLGCSLYFALTGVPPFPGGSSKQKRQWHRTESPPPVSAVNPAVPPSFSNLIEQLMAKRPADRPGSAEVVRGLLLTWAEGQAPPIQPSAAHSAKEIVEEIDTRAFDPTLWDAAPMADALPAAGEEPDADDDEPVEYDWKPLIMAGGAVVAVGLLVLIFGLLRRI
jgi:serine/threonine protein kinase